MRRATYFTGILLVGCLVIGAGGTLPSEPAAPQWAGFEEMNDFYVEAFVNGEKFGVARVAEPDFPLFRLIEVDGKTFRVVGLELVGLLKEPAPRVYVTFGTPAKPDYHLATIRPLDGFEKRALATLRSGDSLVLRDRGKEIRALGAIRADQACLRCHEVSPGHLLGAFTYRLHSTEKKGLYLESVNLDPIKPGSKPHNPG